MLYSLPNPQEKEIFGRSEMYINNPPIYRELLLYSFELEAFTSHTVILVMGRKEWKKGEWLKEKGGAGEMAYQ